MTNVLIAGERIDLIDEAFRGMEARRQGDQWISRSGRLDRVPGEALVRALQRVEAELPRRIGSTREEHRAAALDEIARQLQVTRPRMRGAERREQTERALSSIDAAIERFRREEAGERHLTLVP